MTSHLLIQNNAFTHELADWLVLRSDGHSITSNIEYHLVGRILLLTTALFALAESMSRAVMCVTAFTGHLVTLGYWQQAKDVSMDQMQKGFEAGYFSYICFLSIISPQEFVHYLGAPEEITALMSSQHVIENPDLIASLLQRQHQLAQNQANQESARAFQYLEAPDSFSAHSERETVSGYEVGVCHYIGRRPTMEDEHLTTSFNLNVAGTVYPIQLFGIFDGHGGGEASRYVKENLERKLNEILNEFCSRGLTDERIWNALTRTFVGLDEGFNERRSGTTATLAMILDGKLWTANLGDSRTILDDGTQLSEDASPNDPRYRRGIAHRGGMVINNRINGRLAVARAIGDHNVGAVSARPTITVHPVRTLPSGSHLVLTCDGIYDVASTRQVAAAVRSHRAQSAAELAKNIVYSAFEARSGDNLSAMIVKLS